MSQIIAYYRIGSYVIASEFPLPSFQNFLCAKAHADAYLTETKEHVPDGTDILSGSVIHRRVEGGWFFHDASSRYGEGLLVSEDYSSLRLAGKSGSDINESDEWFIRIAIECGMIRKGYVSLHAAAVALDGKAYAFTGPSGMGKSTRADAWRRALGASLISGDRPLIHVGSMTLYGVPWDGKEQCFVNVSCPLEAIFDIRRAETTRVRQMSFEQKRKILLRQSFMPMWDTALAAAQMVNIARLAGADVTVRAFGGPNEEDARSLYTQVQERHFLEVRKDMKAKSGFVLRDIMDEHMLMPVDENIGKFDGTVIFNEPAAFLWKQLQNPVSRDDLLKALLDEYEVDEATASADLDAILKTFKELDIITEE